jgi:hypothetical protein
MIKIFFFLVCSLTAFSIPQQNIKEDFKQKLEELSRLGVQYKFLDENTIELENTLTGLKSRKTLLEPSAEAIYNWANLQDIPVLEIDPTQIDTSKWTGWYNYWTYVWIGNSERIPTQIKDFDGNGFPELYGIFSGIGFDPEFRIFEVYPDGSSIQRFGSTTLQGGLSTHIVDVDKNGLKEVIYWYGQNSYFYEQSDTTSLPIQLKFVFNKYDGNGAYLSDEVITYMDDDSLIDFVHRGADTSISQNYLKCVSEFNPTIPNFERKWYIYHTDDFYDGFDVGDYDGDGKMEFIMSSIEGRLEIVENIGDDNYEVIFQDSLPLVNMYYQASGDLDGDGKREFFIGATMGNGNWTTMFETDIDNNYTPKFIFHLLSGGSLDDPTYITDDIDNDGKLEFAILSGGYLYIFKSDGDDSYYLWNLKQVPASFSMNFYDMNGDGIKDILFTAINESRWTSEIYLGTDLINDIVNDKPNLPDKIELSQNFPNPFNPSTKIKYSIPKSGLVSLKVYDILGNEIETLVNEEKPAGEYSVEFSAKGGSASGGNAMNLPSGVYFYQLKAGDFISTKKLVLLK